MMKAAVTFWKLDRILLAIYLIALFSLLIFPIAGPDFRLLGIGADKWMHGMLFGGLAVFLRWNLVTNRHATLMAVGAAFIVAVATEIAQALVVYRSADVLDLLAGLIGAMLGALCMNHFVLSPVPSKPVGLVVVLLGLMVGSLFGLADVIGVGRSNLFGSIQMAGTALGALITLGGFRVYLKG
jgi:hypothetical protein